MNKNSVHCGKGAVKAPSPLTGFTIIELLIAIVLMIIILAAIAFVFAQSSETVNIGEARMEVYTNARYALDFLEQDLQNMLAFDGRQEFLLTNGWYYFNATTGDITASRTGPSNSGTSIPPGGAANQWKVHIGWVDSPVGWAPADVAEFKTIVSYDDQQQLARVRYKLEPWETIIGYTGTEDFLRHWTRTVKSRRPIYAFVRDLYIWSQDLNAFEFKRRQELCHFALGFNVEYFAINARFSQLDLPSNLVGWFQGSPCPNYDSAVTYKGTSVSPVTAYDPLGNNDNINTLGLTHDDTQGWNDTTYSTAATCPHCSKAIGGANPANRGTPFRIPYIRVTLQVLEGVAERQERVITKVIWIPVG